MKNLFYLIVIIALPLIAFFQFQNWRRFHPPKDYTEAVSTEIDPSYHDPETVLEYYQNLQQAATYARYCWREHRIDVRSESPHSPKNQVYLETYHQYLASARMNEQTLINSANWKKAGYDNEQIRLMEQKGEGLPMELKHLLGNNLVASMGERSQLIFEVQKALVEKGYVMPVDGVFKEETQDALKKFQRDQGLYASGTLDRLTLSKIYEAQQPVQTIEALPDSLTKDSLDQSP